MTGAGVGVGAGAGVVATATGAGAGGGGWGLSTIAPATIKAARTTRPPMKSGALLLPPAAGVPLGCAEAATPPPRGEAKPRGGAMPSGCATTTPTRPDVAAPVVCPLLGAAA